MNLRRLPLSLLALCLAATATLAAADLYRGECRVRFEGDSTLHGFEGDIPPLALTVQIERPASGPAQLHSSIPVTITNLTTHHEKRDANMYQMFSAAQYPLAHVEVRNASLEAARLLPVPSPQPGSLPLRLTLGGVTNELQAVTRNQKGTADQWEFDLEFNVSLKAFGLKPPSAVLGTVRVKDTVQVRTHVTLRREEQTP